MHAFGLSDMATEIPLAFPDAFDQYPRLVIDPAPSIKGLRWPDGKFREFRNATEKVVKNELQKLIDAGLVSSAGFDGYRITLTRREACLCLINDRGTIPGHPEGDSLPSNR